MKYVPVAPSAKSHCVDRFVCPAAAPPPLHNGEPPKYIVRSAIPG